MAVRKFADATGIAEFWSKVKSYISGVLPTKTSDLTNDSGYITGMEILSYGISTWDDFTDAYNAKKVVYCRASSNSNPASGSQTRLAFMAYVNNAVTPTEVEFQYYRSINTHTESQQGDQVFVYKLTSANKWTVITREAASKVAAGGDLTRSYSNGTVTISGTIPTVPTNISAFTNDAGYITGYTETDPTVPAWAKASSKPSYTASEVGAQPTLVSGTNIKTVNGNSLLGSGDLTIQGGGSKNVWYGTCSTRPLSTEKIVTTTSGDFELTDGNIIIVSFENPVAGSPRLNVDGTGAVVVDYNDEPERVYQGYSTIAFVYDENAGSFIPINRRRANGNNFGLVTGNDIPHDISQVSITVANWNATTTCTKSVTGVTASNSIIVSPAPSSIADYVEAGVYCSAQGSGTLTFTASSTPTADLVVNVMIVG